MFSRTDVGISSEHLFYDVDFVVYCEGPEQSDASASADELFWTEMLRANGLSCKCKSLGSKSEVKPIAEKVANGSVTKTIAAMDRDYDDLFGDLILHPNVLYTFGYSWESDVVDSLDFAICATLFFDSVSLHALANDLAEYKNRQKADLARACKIDISYVRSDQALFDRKKPMAIISQKAGSEPVINKTNLLSGAKKIGRQNRVLPNSMPKQISEPFKTFYGKAVSKMIYFWFAFLSSKFLSSRKVPYDAFMSIATRTASLGQTTSPRDVYYAHICGKVVS